jgi:hypothetical protein
MPVVRTALAPPAATGGLYQFLADREEAEHHDWVTNHVLGRAGQLYRNSRRLAALRAGQPVTLALREFPEWARPSQPADSLWTVYADDRVLHGAHDGAPTALDELLDL